MMTLYSWIYTTVIGPISVNTVILEDGFKKLAKSSNFLTILNRTMQKMTSFQNIVDGVNFVTSNQSFT